MAVSTRTRFEVFKRDSFTCRYCGRKSPEVVLEIDHITAIANGGTDDTVNLTTSCWSCNRGKSHIPLERLIVGEDPVEKAILILEQERQLAEYNKVLAKKRKRRDRDLQTLVDRWCEITGKEYVGYSDLNFLKFCVTVCPVEQLLEFMEIADRKGVRRLQYVSGCLKNWRSQNQDRDTDEEMRA